MAHEGYEFVVVRDRRLFGVVSCLVLLWLCVCSACAVVSSACEVDCGMWLVVFVWHVSCCVCLAWDFGVRCVFGGCDFGAWVSWRVFSLCVLSMCRDVGRGAYLD